MKKIYVRDLKSGDNIESSFMIMKKVFREGNRTTFYIGDRTGDLKAVITDEDDALKIGDVIKLSASYDGNLVLNNYEKIMEFDLDDYLPSVERPIEEIMDEIEEMSKEEFKTRECIELNNYFFRDDKFIEDFKKGIGGVSQHHNYRGGLAEHTLNVMFLTKEMCYRYNARNKEIAILGAKLHDIGKIQEYYTDGPFSFSLKGEMEGHIVIGVSMLEEAFKANADIYSQDFMERIKGCIVQHHGKLEYGSPKEPNMEESYIVHFADMIDATLNKITQIKEGVMPENWSPYDRRIGGKLYI